MANSTGIYVHLPFCPYICPYCDFAKWPHRRSAALRYLSALHAEIDNAPVHDDAGYSTVFLGGGTPNTYNPQDIAALLARLRECFPGPSDRETTIEVNPELVRSQDLVVYREAGVTRLSTGVQSFVSEEIRTLGRKHTVADVEHVVGAAREAGIESVSIDLIFAVPGQTPQSWWHSLQTAIDLSVDHISAYGLTVEAATPYERWHDREPQAFFDDTHEAELYDLSLIHI